MKKQKIHQDHETLIHRLILKFSISTSIFKTKFRRRNSIKILDNSTSLN